MMRRLCRLESWKRRSSKDSFRWRTCPPVFITGAGRVPRLNAGPELWLGLRFFQLLKGALEVFEFLPGFRKFAFRRQPLIFLKLLACAIDQLLGILRGSLRRRRGLGRGIGFRLCLRRLPFG